MRSRLSICFGRGVVQRRARWHASRARTGRSFTGSSAAGRRGAETAAPLLKRVHLELGGNSALACSTTPTWISLPALAPGGLFFI